MVPVWQKKSQQLLDDDDYYNSYIEEKSKDLDVMVQKKAEPAKNATVAAAVVAPKPVVAVQAKNTPVNATTLPQKKLTSEQQNIAESAALASKASKSEPVIPQNYVSEDSKQLNTIINSEDREENADIEKIASKIHTDQENENMVVGNIIAEKTTLDHVAASSELKLLKKGNFDQFMVGGQE